VRHPRTTLGFAIALTSLLAAPTPATAYPSYADQKEGGATSKFRLHGYGEVHYNNPRTGTMDQHATSEADYHRFVLGWSYDFTPDLSTPGRLNTRPMNWSWNTRISTTTSARRRRFASGAS
jgi:hypothetical protein